MAHGLEDWVTSLLLLSPSKMLMQQLERQFGAVRQSAKLHLSTNVQFYCTECVFKFTSTQANVHSFSVIETVNWCFDCKEKKRGWQIKVSNQPHHCWSCFDYWQTLEKVFLFGFFASSFFCWPTNRVDSLQSGTVSVSFHFATHSLLFHVVLCNNDDHFLKLNWS